MQCTYTGRATLHPFAFRVHAHSHGVMNEGNVIHDGRKYLIGKMSPQEPQTYYLTENKTLLVHPNDVLEAECHMVNKENREVPMGHTRQDEMCNFYMMYSVPWKDKDQLDSAEFQVCDDTKLKEKMDKLEREVKLTLGKDFEDEEEEKDKGDPFEELLPGSDFYGDRDFGLDTMGGY
ncbi:putative peptidylglycine alpha-hydroxylating monooxygenase [Fasciola hepatica]|uniref:Peptidylglycine alpha-hydroxylating monooxygenase n=1 Tax=Fasciola hepatica TaxID=6192 RepID=A0A4E0R655_FASHE|nr:putative peptidylglycine alpha-hydroxylating monooxygenase [Fasciola hepatica]